MDAEFTYDAWLNVTSSTQEELPLVVSTASGEMEVQFPPTPRTGILGLMEGVTTAIVLFIFFCIAYPQHIKNRPQFYSALGIVCLIILFQAFSIALIGHGVVVFLMFAAAVMQIFTILLLFMAAGGLSWADLKDDMAHSYEVIRRGGDEKEIIVPLSGEMARRPANAPAKPVERVAEQPPGAIRIEAPKPVSPADMSVPLEE